MTVLERLRAETRTLHEELERRVDIMTRLNDLASYRELLEAFYGFYQPTEASLARLVQSQMVGLDFEPRRKAGLLEGDLLALGREPAEVATCGKLVMLNSVEEALGCMYVLEGATLGGQIIRRQVAERLGLNTSNGCGFFGSYGDRVGEMWKEFRQAVIEHADRIERQDAIVVAAKETFAMFGAWISERLVKPHRCVGD